MKAFFFPSGLTRVLTLLTLIFHKEKKALAMVYLFDFKLQTNDKVFSLSIFCTFLSDVTGYKITFLGSSFPTCGVYFLISFINFADLLTVFVFGLKNLGLV